jgi:hypothetical protein
VSARRALAAAPLGLAAGTVAVVDLYLLGLVVAAAAGRRERAKRGQGAGARFAVLIPAHDEEASVGEAVEGVRSAAGAAEAIVVADNCTDATARVAAEAGATVWERHDPARFGKGHALEWALDRVLRERPDLDGVVVMDADCTPSANLVAAVASRAGAGARAMQVRYAVAAPERSPATALRWAGFALMNEVRPRGKAALGLSCGLFGSGMAFTADLLRSVPWRAHGLVEDFEQHIALVGAGERVEFVAEASVVSPMPGSLGQSESQQRRWEGGRLATGMSRGLSLAADGIRRRDPGRLHAGLEPLVPPQSALAATAVATGVLAARLRLPRTLAASVLAVAAQAAYVLGGLAVARAPAPVWRSLVHAPALVAFKLRIYLSALAGRGPARWERTER